MFAYCKNNPTNMYDRSGRYPVFFAGDTPPNSLPIRGEPNSSQVLYNPDGTVKQKRWYGPEGDPDRDRDNNHPGSGPFPHDHEWKDGKRGKDHLPPSPDYEFSWEPLVGVGLVTVSVVGLIVVVVDDLTGVGVGDDFLIGPLGASLSKGIAMIF